MSDFYMPFDRMPRIEAGDVYQFVKNVGPVAVQSVHVSVYNPAGTLISSLASATQSGTSTSWYHFYTAPTSFYTTVESSGIHVFEWVITRSTGTDHEKIYFEVFKTDLYVT